MNKSQKKEHIVHSMPPIVDENCIVLINGSMLSPKSREYECYYGHPQNRFWKIIPALFGDKDPISPVLRHEYVLSKHIALWNVIKECDIVGASDASISNVIPNDMGKILKIAPIHAIFNLGKKAGELFSKHFFDLDLENIRVETLPSPSPANAACKFDELLQSYQVIKDTIDSYI